jgi:hypothetical protein
LLVWQYCSSCCSLIAQHCYSSSCFLFASCYCSSYCSSLTWCHCSFCCLLFNDYSTLLLLRASYSGWILAKITLVTSPCKIL